MEIFSLQNIAVFNPPLPAIGEEYTPAQTYSDYSLKNSFGRADNSERVFHVHHTAYPIILAIARAIYGASEDDIMAVFRYQRIPLFEPSLPAIEEGYHTLSALIRSHLIYVITIISIMARAFRYRHGWKQNTYYLRRFVYCSMIGTH